MRFLKLIVIAGSFLLAGNARAAVHIDTLPRDWHLRDANGVYFGIGLDRAYQLLQGRKPQKIVVGVIDSGVDTLHEDLKAVLWHNPKGRKGESLYPGSYYGWSFLGSTKGNVNKENLELVRIIRRRAALRDTLGDFPALMQVYQSQYREAQNNYRSLDVFLGLVDQLAAKVATTDLAGFRAYKASGIREGQVYRQIVAALQEKDDFSAYRAGLAGYKGHVKEQLDFDLNMGFEPRSLVGDREFDADEKFYGTSDVNGTDPLHGTHVAGIIAADRVNGLGMQGVADAVSVLTVRAVPNGDERDKDIANAIRYAVDHGAKVINMSFGKGYSPDKKVVDKAVAYAIKKDVLLVSAAGNEHKNIDSVASFPNKNYLTGGEATAWIVVGASGPYKGSALPAGFSNYGKRSVDLFAPGVDIYSTLPGGKYGLESGTSMASPVVAGIAALLRSYFPKLSALQVKDILMRSVIRDPVLADKCLTGGVVNAAKAVELALKY